MYTSPRESAQRLHWMSCNAKVRKPCPEECVKDGCRPRCRGPGRSRGCGGRRDHGHGCGSSGDADGAAATVGVAVNWVSAPC